MFWRACSLFLILSFALVAQPQSTQPGAPVRQPIFQSKVRVVVVDVVVTQGKGETVASLRKQDFQVMEDGKPQKISSFEEHKGADPTQIKLPPMPNGVYTNYPLTKTADSVNVLLLDSLNTEPKDQVFVRKQMIKFLQNVPLGTRLGIFTLGSRLRMIKGVTADSSGLLASLSANKAENNPHYSRLNPTAQQKDTDREIINLMVMNQASPEAITALQQFQAENQAYETGTRVQMTLLAFQQLARYLSSIPGRKNIIWVSGAFPVNLFPDGNMPHEFQQEVQQTADMLTSDQIAIYPISAGGLVGFDQYDTSVFNFMSIHDQNDERSATQMSMVQLAQDTGGQAFYNVNGLTEAVTKAVNEGSHYYTLAYTPANKQMNGKYRRIQVKLAGNYKLSYRRGYYADNSAPQEQANVDPLLPLVGFGMPDFSQVLYKVRILPTNPQPSPDAAIAGVNEDLKKPITRYAVDFAVSVDDLRLLPTSDGIRHGSIELILVAYDRDGKPLNMVTEKADVLLKPKVYASMQKVGLQLHKEIDVPPGEVYLRTGIYDLDASNAGTLGVTLNSNTTSASASPTR
jgi:VWFA-related protein